MYDADPRVTPAETNLSAQDPVCGMSVDTSHPGGGTHIHAGATYYFCNPGCREKFTANPDRYLSRPAEGLITFGPARPRPAAPPPGASSLAPPGSRVEYICPMDPEIVRDRPGACPKCGMALEPRTIRLDEGPNPELIDMTRRFRVSVVVGLPVVALAAADLLFPGRMRDIISLPVSNWIQLLLSTPVVLWAGNRSSSGAGRPSSTAASTCSPSLPWASAPPFSTAWPRPSSQAPFPGAFARTARSNPISTPRWRSRPWSCSARSWNSARAAGPARPFERCSASPPRPRAASATGARRTSRSIRSCRAQSCACG